MTALYAVAFLSSLGFSIVVPFLVFLVTRFGGNAFVLGALGAAFWAAQLAGSIWLGALSDRIGRQRVLGVAAFHVSAGVVAVATCMSVALARGRAQPGTVASRAPRPSAIVG
jgi:MFS family permease